MSKNNKKPVLHAVYNNDNFVYFWLEGYQVNKNNQCHPYALSQKILESCIESLDYDADGFTEKSLILPSKEGLPIPSHQNIDHSLEIEFETWQVPCFYLEGISNVAFFSSLYESEEDSRECEFGPSVLYLFECNKILLEVLSAGRYLPAITHADKEFFSLWEPAWFDASLRDKKKTMERNTPLCVRALPELKGEASTTEEYIRNFSDITVKTFAKKLSFENLPDDKVNSKILLRKNWLDNLLEVKRSPIEGTPVDLIDFETQLTSWKSKLLNDTQEVNFKLALELAQEGNPSSEKPWQIKIYVKPTNIDELTDEIIPLKLIADRDFEIFTKNNIDIVEAELFALKKLGKVAEIFPSIEEQLSSSYLPHTIAVDSKTAYNFLHTGEMEKAGIITIPPRWWEEHKSDLGVTLQIEDKSTSSNSASSEKIDLNKLVEFSWKISIGENEIELDKFKELFIQNGDQNLDENTLAFIEGQWVEIEPEKIKKTIDYLDREGDKNNMSLFEALKLSASSEDFGIPITDIKAQGWINDLLTGKSPFEVKDSTPESFVGELRPYQSVGYQWMDFLTSMGLGACLADDMGLGKTIQLIAWLCNKLERYKQEDKVLPPVLLFAPMSVIDNWASEIQKFAPTLTYHVHHGPERLTGAQFIEKAKNSNIVISTYSLSYRDEEQFNSVHWECIVLDEAQNIKNSASKQAQAIKSIVNRQDKNELGYPYIKRMALTGTPLENHLSELWSIFDFLNPGLLGQHKSFKKNFILPIEKHKSETATKRLAVTMKPFILRRLKTDPTIIDDLPEKIEMDVLTPLTAEQSHLYQKVIDGHLDNIDKSSGIERKGLVLSMISKLKQICNHPNLYLKKKYPKKGGVKDIDDKSGKIERLKQILEVVLAEDDKVLIFTQFAEFGKIITPYLSEVFNTEVLFLHGGTKKDDRAKYVQQFQNEDKYKIFVLSLRAGGYGLNLTAANQVIHIDQWWNPATQQQATDRAYRIGQKRNVQVRKFICKGTLEEKIAKLLESKKNLADQIVTPNESLLTEMSTSELKEFITLKSF